MNIEPVRRPRSPYRTEPALPVRIQTVTRLMQENDRLRAEVDRLRAEALTDALTGLANRRSLDERLAAELSRANRYAQPLSILWIDVDDFKRINDTWGHAKGDEVLVWVGRFLRSQIRAHDIAGRLGGDEFAVVLPATDRTGAEALADRLRRALGAATGGGAHPISLSIGVGTLEAGASTDGVNGDAMLRAADEDMYRQKGLRRPRTRPSPR